MITGAIYQLPLIALLVVAILRDGLRRRMVSAAMLGTVAIYAAYVLAIDVTGQIAQVRVFDRVPPEFIAANGTILAIFTLSFLVGGWLMRALIPDQTPSPRTEIGVLGPLIAGAMLVLISADGWWLFAPYPLNKGAWQLVSLGGAGAVANLLLLFAVNRARSSGRHVRLARTVLWAVALHYVLAGDRGSLLFLVLGAFAFDLATTPRRGWRVAIRALCVAAIALYALEQISFWRSWGVQTQSSGGSFLAEIDLLPQSVAHMFHAISIRLSGYQTVAGGAIDLLATLWLQVIPSGVLRGLGMQTYNGPLLLSEFVVHGGGFFVPAELYFAHGFPSVALIALYFGALAAFADRCSARPGDTFMTTLVLLVAASSFYTMFYGVQAVHRMLSLPVLLVVLRALLQAVLRRHTRFRAW